MVGRAGRGREVITLRNQTFFQHICCGWQLPEAVLGEHDQGEQNAGGGEVEPHAADAPRPLQEAQPGASRALPGRAHTRLLLILSIPIYVCCPLRWMVMVCLVDTQCCMLPVLVTSNPFVFLLCRVSISFS